MKAFFSCVLFLAGTAPLLTGQAGPSALSSPECVDRIDDITSSTNPDQRREMIRLALSLGTNAGCLARVLEERQKIAAFANFVKVIEADRTDKQAGGSISSGSGTSLVSRGLTARFLSVATEYGALTESVNNRTVTIKGSFDGLPAALVRANLVEFCPGEKNGKCVNQRTLDFLRRISYSVSFDTGQSQAVSGTANGAAQGSAQQVLFTANRHQISAVSGRFIFWNRRDLGASFETNWKTLNDNIRSAGGQLWSAFNAVNFADLACYSPGTNDAIRSLCAQGEASLMASSIADLSKVFGNWAAAYADLAVKLHPVIGGIAHDFLQKKSVYTLEQYDFAASLAQKPVGTFEYVNNRPIGQSPTSTFRVIWDQGISKPWSLTVNGAFTIYDSTPPATIPGASRLRDAQAGLQIQRDLGSLSFLGAAAASGTYYFQYQNSPAILNVTPGTPLPDISLTGLPATATQVFSQKGNLHIGQLRLVLGAGQSSVRFPLAVSLSNRTELINKPVWRAQVGVSYDFDALFAK